MTTQTKNSAKSAPKAAAAKVAPKPAEKAAAAPAKPEVEVKETIVVALEPVEAVEKATEEAVKTVVETSEQFVAATQEQVEKASAALAEGYDEFAAIQKEGLDAWIKASTILAKGAEDLSKAYFAIAQDAAATNSEAAQALLAAKSLQEIVDLQSEFARKAFDKSVAEGTKISELSLKIANEAFGPIQVQLSTAVEKAMKPLAA